MHRSSSMPGRANLKRFGPSSDTWHEECYLGHQATYSRRIRLTGITLWLKKGRFMDAIQAQETKTSTREPPGPKMTSQGSLAAPASPVQPKQWTFMVVAIGVGLAICLGVALVVSRFTSSSAPATSLNASKSKASELRTPVSETNVVS